jgi:hypothetical protein
MTEHEWNGDYEILEEHTDIDEVSRRERELQRQYGYPVDHNLYSNTAALALKKGGRAHKGRKNDWNIEFNKSKRKLTTDNVRYIRSSNKTQKELCAELGVTKNVIHQIRTHKTYKDV